MGRLAALIVLLIPGFAAAYGIKLMRDSIFSIPVAWIPNMTLQFILGFVLMTLGIGFFGGFLLRRDQRKGRVQEKFQRPDVKEQVAPKQATERVETAPSSTAPQPNKKMTVVQPIDETTKKTDA
ncbi:DUF2627 family protein [Planococcaceae bacterium Storch 2/2-2]|nr:DUF2627 family protein [Planococcaceae bacterium Storch 2/2-2]